MNPDNRYQALLNSPLYNISEPDVLDDFWADLSDRADQQWYIRDLHEDLPESPADEEDIQEFIIKADALLHKSLQMGEELIVEVDDTSAPTFIKLHSNVSLNGGSAEDWTLSQDAPATVMQPDDTGTIMEKGGPLLRWFSTQTQPIPEATNTSATVAESIAAIRQPDETSELASVDAETTPNQPSLMAEKSVAIVPDDILPVEASTLAGTEEIPQPIHNGTSEANQSEAKASEPNMDASIKEKSEPGYLDKFDGRLVAIRKWEDLDELWAAVHGTASAGWYIYSIGQTPPTETSDSESVHKFLLDIDTTLRLQHQEEYCGIVYADDRREPNFVKIYDPQNLGMVCGSSDTRTLPGWTLSHVPPVELVEEEAEEKSKGGFLRWKGFFKRS